MIEIDVQKIIGTHTGTVNVRRDNTIFTQQRRVGKKPVGREGAGKINKLPDNVKAEIMDLRSRDYSGVKLKDSVETFINNELLTGNISPDVLRSLITAKVVSEPSDLQHISRDKPKPTLDNIPDDDLVNQNYSLHITPQGLTDWAKKRGAAGKARKTMEQVKKEVDDKWKSNWDKINRENSKLVMEIQEIRDKLEASKKNAKNIQQVRERLRTDLSACNEKLKS